MKQRSKWIAIVLFYGLMTFAVVPQPALAATFTASNDAELVVSIATANGTPYNADTIILTADITLTDAAVSDSNGKTALPYIQSNITIDGQGHTIQRSSSAPNFRIALVSSGSLTVVNTTLSNGNMDNLADGGAILNNASLIINHSILSGNSGDKGGAIYSTGPLNIYNSTLSGNSANFSGGAIYGDGGNATINNTIFTGNSSLSSGGAITGNGGNITINNSTFSGNSATDNGGAVTNSQFSTLTINSSLFTNNTSTGVGGAIYQIIGSVTINNSTITGNSSPNYGGVVNDGGTLILNHSTITGNSSTTGGANGLSVLSTAFSPSTTVSSSIIANNLNGNCSGTITSDFSLDNDGSCSGFINSPTIKLASLSDNGGPTKSIALNAGSSALNLANPTTCPGLTDQRGVARSIDANGIPNNGGIICDIGAFEADGLIRTLQFATIKSSFNWGSAPTIPVTLSLDAPLTATYGPVTAYVWETGGTATAGVEYAPFGIQTAVFNPGDQTKVVNINLLNVALTTNKTIVLHFATTNGPGFSGPARLGTQLTHTVTLKASPLNAAPMRNYFKTKTPTLTWNRITQAIRYEVAIATNNSFSGATQNDAGNMLAFTWPVELANGTYYWRVRGCRDASEASCGGWSAPDTFVVFVP